MTCWQWDKLATLACLEWAYDRRKPLHSYGAQLLMAIRTAALPYASDISQVEHLNIHSKTNGPHYKSNFKGKIHCKFHIQVSFYCSMRMLTHERGSCS